MPIPYYVGIDIGIGIAVVIFASHCFFQQSQTCLSYARSDRQEFPSYTQLPALMAFSMMISA